MNKYQKWVKQGRYKTQKGARMILELDKEKGTILSPLTKRDKNKQLKK